MVEHTVVDDTILYQSELSGLSLLHRGKVRDLYALDAERLLIVTTDRLSAFDVVLPDPIPGKGRVLNTISLFWFARTADLIANQLTGLPLSVALPDRAQCASLSGRAVIVKRAQPLPLEAVVRGYLAGSAWKEYQHGGCVCGIALPPGLSQAEALPEPIFTPATKAAPGEHDQNISFETVVSMIGAPLAARVREVALSLYQRACEYAHTRGIIIADTKFEFGLDERGQLLLIDEVLTPDSSRFWPADTWKIGASPPSFDKQYVRDYLEAQHWDKRPPAPRLPSEVIARTAEKYREVLARLSA